MGRPDIVVIGASSGGVEALQELVAGLPSDLAAAVFVVLHIPASMPSALPAILSRSGVLPASHPQSGDPVRHGHIYVSPPDVHLLVEDGRIALWRGPKENRARPSINPLFRSAAVTYGERVIGVILTGNLDDGSAGLWWVKKFGGIAMVQDPAEAAHKDMPRNALEYVKADFIAPVREISRAVAGLTQGRLVRPPAAEEDTEWRPENS